MRTSDAAVRGKLLKWSLAGYAAYFVEMAVGVAISVLLVRTLSLMEFGAYKIAGAILTVGSYLTSCGVDAAIQRFGAELIAKRELQFLRRLLLKVRAVRALALLVFCGCLFGYRAELARLFSFPPTLLQLLPLVCGVLVVQSATSIVGIAFLSARGAFIESSVFRAATALMKVVGVAIACWIGLGLSGVFGGYLAAGALGFAFLVDRNRRWWNGQSIGAQTGAFDRRDFNARIVRFALIGYLASGVNVLRDLAVDAFVLAHYLGVEQVAVYGLAGTLFLLASALNPAALLRSVVTPLLTARHARDGELAVLQDGFSLLSKGVLLLHWPLVTALLVFGPQIIGFVYSPKYAAAYEPLTVLCSFAYVAGLTYPFVPVIAVMEKNVLVLLSGLTAVYNLVMSIILVPRYGLTGAAFATGSAAMLQLVLYWVVFRFVFAVKLTFPFAVAGRALVNLVPVVGIGIVVRSHVGSLLELLIALVGCGALYAAIAYRNHGLTAAEWALVGLPARRSRRISPP